MGTEPNDKPGRLLSYFPTHLRLSFPSWYPAHPGICPDQGKGCSKEGRREAGRVLGPDQGEGRHHQAGKGGGGQRAVLPGPNWSGSAADRKQYD